MSVWLDETASPSLLGVEGELVCISIEAEPRCLERLLDTLAGLSFPINPQIYHDGGGGRRGTVVEFPAYASRLDEVKSVVAAAGFSEVSVRTMIDEIQGGAAGQ